jgi:hypothetical protein
MITVNSKFNWYYLNLNDKGIMFIKLTLIIIMPSP